MRLMRVGVASLILAWGAAAGAQSPPSIEYKGLRLGEPVPEGNEVWRATRCDTERTCTFLAEYSGTPSSIAEQPMKTLLVVRDDADRIEEIQIVFYSRDFEKVRDAFSEKYRSMKCEKSETQNRMGARFDQVTCTYRDKVGTIMLLKRAGTIEDGRMLMVTNAALAKVDPKKDAKKRSKDL